MSVEWDNGRIYHPHDGLSEQIVNFVNKDPIKIVPEKETNSYRFLSGQRPSDEVLSGLTVEQIAPLFKEARTVK